MRSTLWQIPAPTTSPVYERGLPCTLPGAAPAPYLASCRGMRVRLITPLFWLGLFLGLRTGLLIPTDLAVGQVATPAVAAIPALGFRDFFKLPIGPRGLEPTEKLLRLRDQRVRVQGYMVKEEEPGPGLFMLTPTPVAMAELADGPADYLPAATLFVHLVGEEAQKMLSYRPGLWTMTGILRLGAYQEPNSRVSYVRLLLDDPQSLSPPDHRPPTFLDEGLLRHSHH